VAILKLFLLSNFFHPLRIRQHRCISDTTSKALYSAVENCRVQIEALNQMLRKAMPREGDSWAMRSKRVFASLRQDAQVAEIRARIGDSVQVLMFWHVTAVKSGLLVPGRVERGVVMDRV
jgi:hypothetical protein